MILNKEKLSKISGGGIIKIAFKVVLMLFVSGTIHGLSNLKCNKN
ncbi:MAG: hypothetical protein ACLUFU_06050 [Bacilli bacterium]